MPRYRKTGGSLYEAANRFREYNGAFRRVLRSYRKVGSSLYQFYESGNVATVTLPSGQISIQTAVIGWAESGANLDLGASLSVDGATSLYFQRFFLVRENRGAGTGRVELQLNATESGVDQVGGPEFSDQMEQNGTITIVASDGETVVITGISDATEPYQWIPSNAAAVAAFAEHVVGLADRTLTITFNDNP